MWSWRTCTFSLSLLAVAATTATAQTGTLSGTVSDKATKQPIDAVTIQIKGINLATRTKANGQYIILGVPPGVHAVIAKRLGYQEVEQTGVTVNIDGRRTLDFQLDASQQTLGRITVTAAPPPLIERGVLGSQVTLTQEMIDALPVTSISEALALQQGFQELPPGSNALSLGEERRSTVPATSVRSSRAGSQINFVEGVAVNNPFTGGAAISLIPQATGQVQFNRGYMEPQYGNGIAGSISSAIREGGERFAGSVDYQTTALVGAMGSTPDRLLNSNMLRGYLGGAIPGTGKKLRASVAAQVQTSRATVIQILEPVAPEPDPTGALPTSNELERSITPGWYAFGTNSNDQVVGKLTFLQSPTTKFYVSAVSDVRKREPFGAPASVEDPYSIQVSSTTDAKLFTGGFEKRFGTTVLQVKAGRNASERVSCSVWTEVCARGYFVGVGGYAEADPSESGFSNLATGMFWGGDEFTSTSARVDVISQATDHHLLKFGGGFTKYDMVFDETQALRGPGGLRQVVLFRTLFKAKPQEWSSYLQDVIEYDFLTINVGARFDYALAKGKGFTNPLIPSNETTAREVCEGEVAGIPAFTYGTQTGVPACVSGPLAPNGRPVLLDSATRLAAFDDFTDAEARVAVSPRIGLSFPLTEVSQVFFNAGRYTRNPNGNDLYTNTNIGTIAGTAAEGGDDLCVKTAVKPGTNECHPPMVFNMPGFIGNPNLRPETSTSYEIGFAALVGNSNQYALNTSVWSRDESSRTAFDTSDQFQDIGATYDNNSIPWYLMVVNHSHASARGVELQFRRQPRSGIWGYDVNYGWSRATESGGSLGREFQAIENGDTASATRRTETRAGTDNVHSFNMTLTMAIRQNNLPKFSGARLLKNTSASFTYSYRSGSPFTPVLVGDPPLLGERNSVLRPGSHTANAQLTKRFAIGKAQYGVFFRGNNLLRVPNCLRVDLTTGACTLETTDTRRFNSGINILF
jgi:outer membrane receptor protein involved in Fe transport